jgi:2-iminoacetate synthase
MFIDHSAIENTLKLAAESSEAAIEAVLVRAELGSPLNQLDIATLLEIQSDKHMARLLSIAGAIKDRIYGNRIVVFAPLYISDHCVNDCVYCGYKRTNTFERKRLTREEIQQEVMLLEKMGHKRLALEAGEDPVNCPIDYVVDAIDAIYTTKNDNGAIRRINVNIAATTVENYTKLKEASIGTYILFQETYHQPTYERMHPKSLKGDYLYHLTAFDRAMEAGLDDVGAGVLFGLADYKFEVLALMMHNAHLESKFGVGFHTISVPRIKKAEGVTLTEFTNQIDDDTFKKIVAILRIAVPFTGIIMSTRESADMRRKMIHAGVSQISAGSCAEVGGYKEQEKQKHTITQFESADQRTPLDILKELVADGLVPSYCTACYRSGRTGDRFMQLARAGQIHNVCTPNALMTLQEFILDYGDEALRIESEQLIEKELAGIERDDIRQLLSGNLERIRSGERDLFL